MFDILCVSDMCVDMVMTGDVRPRFNQVEQIIDGYSIELGGSANIFASQAAKLGGRSGVIGWVGEDAFGQFCLETLQSLGVDTSRVGRHPRLKTGISAILAEPKDRAILTYLGTIEGVQPEELSDEVLADCRHWHIASFFLLNQLRSNWKNWLTRCRAKKVTTSLDTNWDPENRWEGVKELLPLVDVFLPNEAEALAISGEPDVEGAGRELAGCGPLVVVKRGSEGAMVFQGKQFWQIRGSELTDQPVTIVDAVGAGDNFDAGFLHSWLKGLEIRECLRWASRCAVSSLAVAGGIRGQLKL